ncbi:hypothetical protein C3H41_08725 [Campylobacter jejuni]|uniref:hypothetical protein n=1 Tax=Campylobacter jejuni TaxID=197 RepID=UPI000F807B74|nr:hypothetical protein [Campylobacter jejuni]RTK00980.1 hypothetical protein C3H41_08725 [Campylobacter jejuni]HEF7700803.1 hypothetical protein [Campylobacter jejuni]HEF7706175.1 hypothetical protein [Campylobacter jejuni]HEF8756371.1 hypothetical protein [Campylobacter jejuni]
MNNIDFIQKGQILGSLSGSALLGVLVLILSFIVWHLYKMQQKENIEKTKELINETKNTNYLIKEQITIAKASNDNLIKYIETHCSKTDEKLSIIHNNILSLKDIRNEELKNFLKKNKKILKRIINENKNY